MATWLDGAARGCALGATFLIATALAPAGAADQRVRLVSGNDYKPYADEGLPEGGMVTSLVRQAFVAAGWEVEPIAFLPWPRGYRDVQEGRFDATFPYVPTSERLDEMRFSATLFVVEVTAYFTPGTEPLSTTSEMLRGRRICHPLGYNFANEEKAVVGAVVENPSIAGCLRMVRSARADALILTRLQGYTAMLSEFSDPRALTEGPSPLRRLTLHLVAARNSARSATVIEAFNRGFEKLKGGRAWERTVVRYIGAGALNWTRQPE